MPRKHNIPDTPSLPNAIREAAKADRLVIFLGAGVCCSVGMASWKEIKDKLIQKVRLKEEVDSPTSADELRNNLRNYDYYELFSYIKTIDQTAYEEVIKEALSTKQADKTKFKEIITALDRLDPASFVTTNIDNLIDQIKGPQIKKTKQCAPQLLQKKMTFKIHGDEDEHIFTTEGIQKYYGNDHFQSFLYNLFGSYCILFIGFSFSDKDLMRMGFLNREALGTGTHIHHYALLASDYSVSANLAHSYGIEPILYRNDSELKHTNFIRTILSWGQNTRISTNLPTGDLE